VAKREVPSLAWLYPVIIAVIGVPALGVGIYLAATGRGWAMLAAGCGILALSLAGWPVVRAIETARDTSQDCINDFMGPFNERMQQMNVMLNLISEQQLISDRAKQVAYRTLDREALRRALQDEIHNKDWEAALALVSDMETVFGYKQEAERCRHEIEQKRHGETRKQVNEGIAVIDRHVRAEKWQEALAEAHRISQQYSQDEQARNLPAQVEDRRVQHKRQLQESFRDAIVRHDNDGAIEILRKLDPYLTPSEAESMQETARNLFKEKLNSLRTQFTLSVQDHNWLDAIRLGDQIQTDFPNTRAAQEVREMMPALQQRLSEGTATPAAETPATA
jgi:hypothetical protein